MREKILELIKKVSEEEVNEDDRFIKNEILTSMSMISLCAELESEFNITIPPNEIDARFFDTISDIENLIERNIKK